MNIKLFPLVLALACLTGCASAAGFPHTHEIESTVLMRTLGVDVGVGVAEGVAVTASSGARPSAGTQQGEAPTVLAAEADTMSAACQRMQALGNEFVFYGDVEQLLIGEELARRSLDTVLAHMARDPELRLEAQVWAVRGGTASDVLFSAAEGEGASNRLEAMREDAGLFSASVPQTAREALVDLARNGCTILPALALTPKNPGDGAEGEKALVSAGYAVFRSGVLAAWTDAEASRGINLLLGKVDTDVLELVLSDQSRLALRITGARTKYSPVVENGILTGLSVTCRVEAGVAERQGTTELDTAMLGHLEAQLAARTKARIEAALAIGQKMNADYLGLKGKAELAAPWHKSILESQWGKDFAVLPVTVAVDANVARE